VRLPGSQNGLAIKTDCTPRYCAADPERGGAQAVAECWRNLTATGARPLAVTDNLNFGNPERPEVMGQLVGCIKGMAAACLALDFPVVSGNVSLYNETNGKAILPTPVIGAVGLIDDVARAVTIAFKGADEAILLIGETTGWLGASLYRIVAEGREDGAPPPVDLAAERRHGDFVRELIAKGQVSACHDVSGGGALVAIAEMALAGGIGAAITPPKNGLPLHGWLFGEDQARYLLATPSPGPILDAARAAGIPVTAIGKTGGAALTVGSEEPISLADLRRIHENWLPGYMARA
jgi:phosphoribosylformylglycinamidine synthase